MGSKNVFYEQRSIVRDPEANAFGPLAIIFNLDLLFGEPAELRPRGRKACVASRQLTKPQIQRVESNKADFLMSVLIHKRAALCRWKSESRNRTCLPAFHPPETS